MASYVLIYWWMLQAATFLFALFPQRVAGLLTLPVYIHSKKYSLKQLGTAAKRLERMGKINVKNTQ